MEHELADQQREELVSAIRATAGEELRSITYFTEESLEQLYLRRDLDRTADLVGFAEMERHGFKAQDAYRGTELGDYRFTIRVFDDGYLTRVTHDGHGVWITTDSMSVDRFEELASAIGSILANIVRTQPN